MMSKYLILIVLIIACKSGLSCPAPAPGIYLNNVELINTTKTIVLAELIKGSKSRFKVIETLKGVHKSEFQWIRVRAKHEHISTDFDEHKNPDFWNDDGKWLMRSVFRSGACYPSFTFVTGEKYLLFVESYGNPHSAEIIKSQNDKWYKFVKSQIVRANAKQLKKHLKN